MRPDAGSTATPSGPLNEPIALPFRPNESSRVPLGWNDTMALLRVDATNMRPDRGSTATELGFESPALAMPPCPNESSSVPLGWNALMRPKPVSATTMRPSGSTATPRGARITSPRGTWGYLPPNSKSNVPLGWNAWIRKFSVSATTMRPDAGSTATPRGIANSPSSAPRLLRFPIAKSYVPLGWNTLIAWFPRSATSMRPCASTAAPYGLCRGAPCSVPLYAADAVVPTSTLPLWDSEPGPPGSGSTKPPGHTIPPDRTAAPLADSEPSPQYPRSPPRALSPGCTEYRNDSVSVPLPPAYAALRFTGEVRSSSDGRPPSPSPPLPCRIVTAPANRTRTVIASPCVYVPSSLSEVTFMASSARASTATACAARGAVAAAVTVRFAGFPAASLMVPPESGSAPPRPSAAA